MAAITVGCDLTIPGHQLDGAGVNGQGTPCKVPAQYKAIDAPVLAPSTLALGATVFASIGSPHVIRGASAMNPGISIKSHVACVADGDTVTDLPLEITASQVGVWPIVLDTGEKVDVDVRQAVDIEIHLFDFGSKRKGQITVGDCVSIWADAVDRSASPVATGETWTWTVMQGDAQPCGWERSSNSSVQGYKAVSAGHFRVDVSVLGLHRSVDFDVHS